MNWETLYSYRRKLPQLGKFLAVGLPAFLLAVPLNYALVELGGISKGVSYALVLVFQVSTNYFLCRWFVFARSGRAWYRDFAWFVSGILAIRCLDWGVYWVLVNVFGFFYLIVQLTNVAIFSVIKFVFSEKVLT